MAPTCRIRSQQPSKLNYWKGPFSGHLWLQTTVAPGASFRQHPKHPQSKNLSRSHQRNQAQMLGHARTSIHLAPRHDTFQNWRPCLAARHKHQAAAPVQETGRQETGTLQGLRGRIRLRLPTQTTFNHAIHNVFHMKLLYPYKSDKRFSHNQARPPPVVTEEGEQEYEIKKIVSWGQDNKGL